MRTSRRLFALVAAFAVAFGALWPLVSVARSGPQIPSFICTQSGFQHPQAPGDSDDPKFHCPLCVTTVDSDVPSFAFVSSWTAAAASVLPLQAFSSFTPRQLAQPPPSRAPPLHS